MKKRLLALAAVSAVASPAGAATVYGVKLTGQLVTFNSAAPAIVTSTRAISGVSGTDLLGIDFRPADGRLYALGNSGQIYTINISTGAATALGPGISLLGNSFGFDFNPVADRIRVVSDADQNLRVNPNTGALAANDSVLAYAAGDPNAGANPSIVASAYTNSVAGSTATTQFGLDSVSNTLVIINPPNNGILNTVGALGVDIGDDASFDIGPLTGGGNEAYFSSGLGFYSVNLATGGATLVGSTAGLRGISIGPDLAPSVPEPTTWLLLLAGFGVTGLALRRRAQGLRTA